MSITPARVAADRGILPEGIVWDVAAERLTWVDIELGQLHEAEVIDGEVRALSVLELGDQLGCALPSATAGWVCGLGRSLATVTAGGVVTATPPLLAQSERFNDGHIDPQGRLVIGTLHSDGPDGRQLLLRLEHDGAVTMLSDALGISNGLAWSPDGAWLYHADTAAQIISRRAYGDQVGEAEMFVEVGGMPDGIAVDGAGNLWVTVFDAGRVDCYAPDGALISEHTIVQPDAHVTSVGFAGTDLDVLLFATGMPVMPGWLQLRRGQDGWLFALPAPVRGLATRRWTPAPLPATLAR